MFRIIYNFSKVNIVFKKYTFKYDNNKKIAYKSKFLFIQERMEIENNSGVYGLCPFKFNSKNS